VPRRERVTPLALDVTDATQISKVQQRVGSLDVLINNVGVSLPDALTVRAALEQHLREDVEVAKGGDHDLAGSVFGVEVVGDGVALAGGAIAVENDGALAIEVRRYLVAVEVIEDRRQRLSREGRRSARCPRGRTAAATSVEIDPSGPMFSCRDEPNSTKAMVGSRSV
jgi:hypothetical protein